MSTLDVSMPDALRAYVEAQAAQGHYSAREYVRQLIREDQKRQQEQECSLLWDLLAISAKQLDDGDFGEATVESLLENGRKRREAERNK